MVRKDPGLSLWQGLNLEVGSFLLTPTGLRQIRHGKPGMVTRVCLGHGALTDKPHQILKVTTVHCPSLMGYLALLDSNP